MAKLKILVWAVQNAGVGKFRFHDPYIALQKNFKDDFIVDIVENPQLNNKDFMGFYDVIVLQAPLVMNDEVHKILEKLKVNGLKIVFDMDDYWRLSPHHALYRKMETQWKTLVSRLKIADLITTTTTNLANEIAKYNKNVKVLPNAINPNEEQFISKPIESDKVRIGWVGGSSHLEDLKELRGCVNKFHSDLRNRNNVQFLMAGFNNQVRNPETGETMTVKRPEVWMQSETIFMHNITDQNYLHYLLNPREEEYPDVQNQFYRRIWTKPIQTYATIYNEIDIVIAPLENTVFNTMKSQLKVIEAGFHKKPLVASKIYPYEIDGIHKKNCFLVDDKRGHKDWYNFTKKLVLDPSMRLDYGEALYETVSKKYDLNIVTAKRAQVLNSLK